MPRVSELMTREVVTLSPETTIREAMEILYTKHLSGAPVVVGARVEGVVSLTDLLEFVISVPESDKSAEAADDWDRSDQPIDDTDDMELAEMSAGAWENWSDTSEGTADDALPRGADPLDQHTVDEVMTSRIVSVTPGTSVKVAAATMNKHGIHRVLVMKDDSLVGILSAFDIVRTVSARGTADDAGVRPRLGKGVPCVWTSDTQRP